MRTTSPLVVTLSAAPRLPAGAVLMVSFFMALSVHADMATFVTNSVTVTPSGGTGLSKLVAACSSDKIGAGPGCIPHEGDASALYAAMNAKGVTEVYVSAMYTTVEFGSLWMWHGGDNLIVLAQNWAPGYPTGDESVLKYAVYSSDLNGLINVDGTKPLSVGCSYDTSPPPAFESGSTMDFPWWAIFIIVLGVVAIVVVVVAVVSCCCCCKKKHDNADIFADGAPVKNEASVRSTGSHEECGARATVGVSGGGHSDSESDADPSTSRSFSQESPEVSVTGGTPNAKGEVHE
ncbi:hypothetical protein GH5_07658 [Leishmania sp. Ghana 2012 LV757]|uniref:hypothetical protein n=1 Tax=Leishmania sp. Ghana 2012 LV757 TaxID=2803181 RepID=UPI001B77191C|nr:hypothetical protein GH5_07658 [Leishmania sp. Ghana 2012 LV757]